MSVILKQNPAIRKSAKPKLYKNEMEKQLMVDNLRAAIEIFGKDQLRKGFLKKRKINCELKGVPFLVQKGHAL